MSSKPKSFHYTPKHGLLEFLSRLCECRIFHGPANKEYDIGIIEGYHREDQMQEYPDAIKFRTNRGAIQLEFYICVALILNGSVEDCNGKEFKIIFGG